MNNIRIEVSIEQLRLHDADKEIRIYNLDLFDLEQVKNFKKFNMNSLIVQAGYIELNIKKDMYVIRLYKNYISFKYKG